MRRSYLLLLGVAAAALLVKQSGKNHHKESQIESGSKQHSLPADAVDANHPRHEAKQEEKDRRRLDAVAIFTFMLTIVAAGQLWAFIQSERAVIHLSNMELNIGDGDRPSEATVNFKNSGRGAAFVTVRTCAHAGILPATPTYNSGIDFCANHAMGELPEGIQSGVVLHLTLPPSALTNIKEKKLPFYIFGVLDAVDEYSFFGGRKNGFCAVLSKQAAGPIYTFEICQENNYTY